MDTAMSARYLFNQINPMKKLILISIILCSSIFVNAQEEIPASTELRKDALNVFIKANNYNSNELPDINYIRNEIPYINYVRDLNDADVYIISSSQRTGSGGFVTTYFFKGQHRFANMSDTLSLACSPDDTEDQIRKMQVSTLKMGLMQYVAKTPLAKYIDIKFTESISEEVTIDKWNSWVFKTTLRGYLQGQKSYKNVNLYGNFEASKITPDWKTRLRLNYGYGSSTFETDEETIKSITKSKSFYGLLVKSIGDHWSIGGSTTIGSSSYYNKEFYATILPGIEYDIYPYSESTTKQLRIMYSLGAYIYQYADTTIYDKTKENLLGHQLRIAYEAVQKWGSVEVDLIWKNYFYDWRKNNLMLNGYINLRVAKGLTFNIGGFYELLHDQLSLPKEGATSSQVLLRQQELESSYNFFFQFGVTFTFGSIYNNVVNPRFGN